MLLHRDKHKYYIADQGEQWTKLQITQEDVLERMETTEKARNFGQYLSLLQIRQLLRILPIWNRNVHARKDFVNNVMDAENASVNAMGSKSNAREGVLQRIISRHHERSLDKKHHLYYKIHKKAGYLLVTFPSLQQTRHLLKNILLANQADDRNDPTQPLNTREIIDESKRISHLQIP